MRFRLTYTGPVRSTQRDAIGDQRDPGAAHKHEIRRAFHAQLKHLWAINRFLREKKLDITRPDISTRPIHDTGSYWGNPLNKEVPLAEYIASRYSEFGYRFVPLVCEDFSLLCSLHILFLRRDFPGSVITAGDIDNRLKTVIDALRRPRLPQELVGNETPKQDENPFFVLLEDDKQVTHFEVETDTLLDPPTADNAHARLIITVEIQPYDITYFNLAFS